MTDAAIKDNYDSGNRFYFRVYLFCSYRLALTPSPPPLPSSNLALLPSADIALIAKTDAMFAPPRVVAGKGRLPACPRPRPRRLLQFNVYFSGDQRGIGIMRIIRVSLQRLAKKLYPRSS